MRKTNGKITVRQAFIVYICSTLSAAIRLFPSMGSSLGKEACWISPVFGAVALWLICLVLQSCFKSGAAGDLSEVFDLSLGKIAGRLLLLIYLFWIVIIYFLYIRYYAERLLSSIFPNTDIRFFILLMVILIYMSSRGRLETLARFSELSFLLFTVVLIMFFLLLIPSVKISNLLPITQTDILPAVRAAYPILGIWGYITLLFFLGDSILQKDRITKLGKRMTLLLAVMSTLMLIFTVGSLGYTVARRMPLPFFSATKLISAIDPLDRLESLLLAIWIVSDFIVISLFAVLITNLMKKLFAVSEARYFSTPVSFLGYVGSQYLSSDRFELELFSDQIGLAVNIILCFFVPILVWAVGKLRRKL